MRFVLAPFALALVVGCAGGTADPGGDAPPTPTTTSTVPTVPTTPGSSPTGDPPNVPSTPGTSDPNPGTPPEEEPTVPPAELCGTSEVGKPLLRRLSRRELVRSLEDVFPEVKGAWTATLSADNLSTDGFDNNAAVLVVGKQTADEIATTAASVAKAVTGDGFAAVLPCSQSQADRACATAYLDKYGKRLFRRPLTDDERTRYLELFDQAVSLADFKTGIAYLTRALVQSPHFVYRREVGTPSGTRYRLTPYEIATALSYSFAGTTPSDELLGKADRGELASPEALTAVAKDLLMASGQEVLHRFMDSWLGYSRVASMQKTNVAEFSARRTEMVEETRRFIADVLGKGGGPRELLVATSTTPTTALASFYGFPAPSADFAPVERPAGRGIGILAQGSLLAANASPNSSSPTKRGLLVFERFLCLEPPMVPPNVPDIQEPRPGITTRERYEEQHASGTCASCHKLFDPIGFGFEQFDEVGRYRADENGLAIDTKSHVPLDGGVLFEFTNLEELAQGLAEQPRVHACISHFITEYVFGGAGDCLGETRRPEFVDGTVGFVDYFASLAAEPHFTERALTP